ncbi:uncharacterized protein LOC129940359 [Eupeodes corollae]|uniref:uncharacterized protein LOC129940359 n=1 Tax=Eupeodes corollae TaxID=290404 RepID=UPI00249064EA|nr:uncharacterized protein LOC129940359 [Eupeodes corollae]XP_055904645.1 uncharacterized protein LOC129940359 [Eupeodes corollae]XP_055904646.1 uncharacterized protein LOC129940359 [Eupeodes corollae]XP_055904647.1 uncharacterized protein LOC129940359 [Eupeodes corollae]XP_055904648.1 uncharacterized protein LOC129940359 [Eupeodes corollae]
MDSRLLNVFHSDQFDGNYVMFDTDNHFWSNDSGTPGLQLAETLHGILPIAPNEVISSNFFSNSILKEGDYSIEIKNNLNTNSKMYEKYDEVASVEILNKKQFSPQQTIDIVSVNPNSAYDTDFLQSTDEDIEIKENEGTQGELSYENVRSCSRSTFRSRTDSSSIGDYESHSSDYDDDPVAMGFKTYPSKFSNNFSSKSVVDCIPDSDNNGSMKSIDNPDPFATHLDVSTFDLAEFITQDDQVFYNHSTQVANSSLRNSIQNTVKLTISSDTDSDSDVIVDVETVENEEIGIDSWNEGKVNEIKSSSPSKYKVENKEIKPNEHNVSRIAIVPCNDQSVCSRRKFGIGRGKNINMHSKPLQATPKPKAKSRLKQNINKNVQTISVGGKINNSSNRNEIVSQTESKEENIIKKQDLSIAKIDTERLDSKELVDQKQVLAYDKHTKFINNEPIITKLESKEKNRKLLEDFASQTPKKRKLNLEEYKKRRETHSFLTSISKNSNVQLKTKSSEQIEMPASKTSTSNTFEVTKPIQTEAVTSVVKSLKENQSSKRFVDPITEAKNKVLRLRELKKAQQIKIIDSTVSSKVARVTKLLPLKDIVKSCNKTCNVDIKTNNSEYEEIIMVSTGCNTDITIPPNGYSAIQENIPTNLSRSLLKSNVWLTNIRNSFQKVHSDESVQISTNSLIVSIQDVVVKKSSPLLLAPFQDQTVPMSSDHGEDKIIMHLSKDRIRNRIISKCTQTDLSPQFSMLLLPKLESSDHCINSVKSKRTKVRRKCRSRYNLFSSDDETFNCRAEDVIKSSRSRTKPTRQRRSSISSSCSESEDFSKKNQRDNDSSTSSRNSISYSEYRRSRSKSFDRIYNRSSRSKSSSRSFTKRRDESSHVEGNLSVPAVEERRIVYVGRIEKETTKEILRQKFLSYGPIKQITIHYKDTGMKYGFVTYEKSEDAFRAIDSGPKDDMINMYDISFGGRRAFCRASYADLDNAGMNSCQSYVIHRQVAPPKEEDSFEALLLKVKAKLNSTKSTGQNSKA